MKEVYRKRSTASVRKQEIRNRKLMKDRRKTETKRRHNDGLTREAAAGGGMSEKIQSQETSREASQEKNAER